LKFSIPASEVKSIESNKAIYKRKKCELRKQKRKKERKKEREKESE
jgi:hypothetical protein